ncbi:hypothetical protein [Pleurocapsa sp. FMAR1]|uniref:hypothetical protein n=1 Tax=Pleurocapsa sp. FMAR1 TaxID=3040204 RepID=UPI0029C78D26|nr:hypothetical protein [Pleurocapsa sp. FMAR1]
MGSVVILWLKGRYLKRRNQLKPFGITKFYTDGLKTYERHIAEEAEAHNTKYKKE